MLNKTWPMPIDEQFTDDEDQPRPLQLMPTFSGDAFIKVVAYPVVVEAWEKKRDGSRKRRYLAEFTEAERVVIGRWHTRFEKWYLRTGTPRRVQLRLSTLTLLQRAVNFFGGI